MSLYLGGAEFRSPKWELIGHSSDATRCGVPQGVKLGASDVWSLRHEIIIEDYSSLGKCLFTEMESLGLGHGHLKYFEPHKFRKVSIAPHVISADDSLRSSISLMRRTTTVGRRQWFET